MHPGIRYAGNSAAEDGLSLFQVGDDVCRLRDDAYIRLYNFPASSAEVQFSMIFPADGDYNRIAMRPSIPFETWQIISEGNPLVSDDLITYSVVPPASDPSLVPARIRPTAPIISGPQESCVFDEEIIYTASTFPLTEFVWNIDGGNLNVVSDSTVEVEWETLPAGLISVVATDEEGCSSVSVDYQVQIFPLPDAEINVTPPLIAFEGQEYTFFSAGSNEAAIRFYFEDGSEFYESPFKKSFDSPGQYEAFLELISPEGCKDRDSVLITVEEGLILSNVITPNGDGYNDFWEVPASGMLLYNLQISNRWGTIVFETKSSKVNWDGRDSAGNQVPPGTYFFTLEAQSASKNYSKRGSIQVFY
jgi:gliding motility-associated-like protein